MPLAAICFALLETPMELTKTRTMPKYCHGMDQMPAPLILVHAYPSAYAYRFDYVCLHCYLLMQICFCLWFLMFAYVCLSICLWVMTSVKEISVGTTQHGGKGSG
jgi:hypothetical protein